MVKKSYEWVSGAKLEDHSRRKHKILREYFFSYLRVRCQHPQQSRFRLAVVDGFAGGGRYSCGTAGSPVIFLEVLKNATDFVNTHRLDQGLGAIDIECLLVLNDADRNVVELLKSIVGPLCAVIAQTVPRLHIHVEYLNNTFEMAYPAIKTILFQGRYRNVLFNLDQYGHSHVERRTLVDIMRTYPSAEVFYTFAVEALVSFLRKSEPTLLAAQLACFGFEKDDLICLQDVMNKSSWLGAAERLVFESFQTCAPFVSPFSINNPDGWRYWFIHFANFYRARQVYNNILHDNSGAQAHFGRSGLNMLSYDPGHDGGTLYLFDESDRQRAKEQLLNDIPRLVSKSGDVVKMLEFYESIYNITPAHTDDVHAAIISNPDMEIITPAGGGRRKANTISVGDIIKLKSQKSFLFMGGNKADDKQ